MILPFAMQILNDVYWLPVHSIQDVPVEEYFYNGFQPRRDNQP
jgi:hypothetical protein